jgi:hypothetical protein
VAELPLPAAGSYVPRTPFCDASAINTLLLQQHISPSPPGWCVCVGGGGHRRLTRKQQLFKKCLPSLALSALPLCFRTLFTTNPLPQTNLSSTEQLENVTNSLLPHAEHRPCLTTSSPTQPPTHPLHQLSRALSPPLSHAASSASVASLCCA